MLRIVLLISLLATLLFTFSQFSSEPSPEPQAAQERARNSQTSKPANEGGFGRRPEVRPVPDVYDGYLFNEERQLNETDFGEFGETPQETAEETAAGLEQVFYAGSLIIGDRREGLVTYRENNRSGGLPSRTNRYSARGRVVTPAAESEFQHQVVKPGDSFMGYRVDAVEPDKIVFTRGGEKIEKFLYDRNKKRPEVSEALRATPSAPGVNDADTTPPTNISPNVGTAPVGASPRVQTPFRRSIRSRRLQGAVNPGPRMPVMPVPAAPPVSPNN